MNFQLLVMKQKDIQYHLEIYIKQILQCLIQCASLFPLPRPLNSFPLSFIHSTDINIIQEISTLNKDETICRF